MIGGDGGGGRCVGVRSRWKLGGVKMSGIEVVSYSMRYKTKKLGKYKWVNRIRQWRHSLEQNENGTLHGLRLIGEARGRRVGVHVERERIRHTYQSAHVVCHYERPRFGIKIIEDLYEKRDGFR